MSFCDRSALRVCEKFGRNMSRTSRRKRTKREGDAVKRAAKKPIRFAGIGKETNQAIGESNALDHSLSAIAERITSDYETAVLWRSFKISIHSFEPGSANSI